MSSVVFSGILIVKESEPDTPDGMFLTFVESISHVHLLIKPTENMRKRRETFRKYLQADWTNTVFVTLK